jgi:hypothetical protein
VDHPASYLGYTEGFFSGWGDGRRQGHDAEIKNGGAIPPLPHMSSWNSAQGQLYLFSYLLFPIFLCSTLLCVLNNLYGVDIVSLNNARIIRSY